MTLYH